MDAFLAFLDHVHGLLTTTYHNTPIMLMASPQWTRPDCETIARYVFEKTRTPALCIINSALATQYGLKWPNMTVVDIGFEKVDVTAVHDGRVVNHMGVGASEEGEQISGGEIFTQRLVQLLKHKNFNHDMAEQLKKSAICEVLPYDGKSESLCDLPAESAIGAPSSANAVGPTAAADTTMTDAPQPQEFSQNGQAAGQGGADDDGKENGQTEDDGVLDVAAIVTSGQTKEFLAKKEKEKESRGRGRRPKVQEEAAPAKPVKLPNSKRTHNTFYYEEIVQEEVPPAPQEPPAPTITDSPPQELAPAASATELVGSAPADAPSGPEGLVSVSKPEDTAVMDAAKTEESKPAEAKDETKTEPTSGGLGSITAPELEAKQDATTENKLPDTPEYRPKRLRKDIEVGLERFTFAERLQIDRIVSAIYRTIQGIDDMYMRPPCWDNLVFVGNGSRLRGLKENILQTLNARHLVSPSNATMFTSELPSNMATPTGTGSQTPTGSFTGVPHQLPSSGVNPLLQAATTASGLGVNAAGAVGTPQAGSEAAGPASHHFHSQTPTSIKTVTFPTYLSEWSKNGFEEAMFLGSQVAARIAFCLHSNMDAQAVEAQRQMSLSRVDYK